MTDLSEQWKVFGQAEAFVRPDLGGVETLSGTV